uniref:Vomeronasal type-1 receptor n=1 Tax=Leptailurus serval TaxID=61405 RepID=A0A0A0Y2M0_LEPSR|nr:vomeronasal receptor type I [Leptailurus serval]
MIVVDNMKENMYDRLASGHLTVGIIFLSQTTVGIVGNFVLLYHYVSIYHTERRLRFTRLILMHLTVANSLVILSEGVPQTLAALGFKSFFTTFACKLFLYVQRVGRGLSISSTCLLSVFQTITISPMNSYWKDLKVKAPKYVGFSIFLCWNHYAFINLVFPLYVLYMPSQWSTKNITQEGDLGYCFTIHQEAVTVLLYAVLIVVPEVLFSVLMIWASGSMVFLLHRHKQRVQHIHSTNVSPRSSAESRATQSILVLVSTFVSFHSLSSIFHVSVAYTDNPSLWLVNTAVVFSVCFPTVCPFFIMSRDYTLPRRCFSWIQNTKSCSVTGDI